MRKLKDKIFENLLLLIVILAGILCIGFSVAIAYLVLGIGGAIVSFILSVSFVIAILMYII